MKKIDLPRVEPLVNTKIPQGQNNLSSRASFFQRKLYELHAFSDPNLSANKPLDLLYEQMFYGRKDEKDNVLQLKTDRLKQIPQPKETVLVIDFVADAFVEFRDYWSYLGNKGILKQTGPLATLKVKKGWSDSNLFYYELMSSYYNKFRGYVSNSKKDKTIKNFNSYLKVFTEFLDLQTPFLPFSKTMSNLSRFNNPNISGIVIELKTETHGDDVKNIKTYISDPNFGVFKTTAMKFGFIVDKHAPWRLFADLKSPAIKPYMDKYNITLEEFPDIYYERSIYADIEILKPYIIQMYNAYVSSKPNIQEVNFSICNGRIKTSSKKTKRKTIKKEEMTSLLSEESWLRLYFFIRAREQNLEWTQDLFEQNVANALQIKKGVDMNAALDYIETKMKHISTSSKKERNFYF